MRLLRNIAIVVLVLGGIFYFLIIFPIQSMSAAAKASRDAVRPGMTLKELYAVVNGWEWSRITCEKGVSQHGSTERIRISRHSSGEYSVVLVEDGPSIDCQTIDDVVYVLTKDPKLAASYRSVWFLYRSSTPAKAQFSVLLGDDGKVKQVTEVSQFD